MNHNRPPVPPPENPQGIGAANQPPEQPEPRAFADVIPYSYSQVPHPTRGGEVTPAADILTGAWDVPRATSHHGEAISPAVSADKFTYQPRKAEATGLATRESAKRVGEGIMRVVFRRPPAHHHAEPQELLEGRPGVRSKIPVRPPRQSAEADDPRLAAMREAEAMKAQSRRLKQTDLALKAEEQELRRQELALQREALRIKAQRLAAGILPDDEVIATQTPPETAPATDLAYEKALRRYNANLALIAHYEADPVNGHWFDKDSLTSLHAAIQTEAGPIYEAAVAKFNEGKADTDKIDSFEKLPADIRRQIIEPIDKSHTVAYLMSKGVITADKLQNEELLKTLTLARLKAVGKLPKPTKKTRRTT